MENSESSLEKLMPSSVTVLVPAYQSAKFIHKTLASIADQTYQYFKVIISEDLCEDRTFENCRSFCEKDERFTVINQKEKRLGYVGNCNFLLSQVVLSLQNLKKNK